VTPSTCRSFDEAPFALSIVASGLAWEPEARVGVGPVLIAHFARLDLKPQPQYARMLSSFQFRLQFRFFAQEDF
jgi:hypothetical protein